MMDAHTASLAGAVVLALMLIAARRLVFSRSMLGVFFLSNVVFVLAGLLLLPWVWNDLTSWFVGLRLELISEEAIQRAIYLNTVGLGLVLVGYLSTHFVMSGGRLLTRAPRLLASKPEIRLGMSLGRIVLAASIVLCFTWAFLLLNLPVIIRGVIEGLVAGQPDVALEARRQSTSNYVFVLVVYNVAPFIAVALWVTARLLARRWVLMLARVTAGSAILLLLLVFQKRPLIVLLIELVLAHWWSSRASVIRKLGNAPAPQPRVGLVHSIQRVTIVAIAGVALFGVLIALYYASTRIARNGGDAIDNLGLLATAALQRIFGRLSIPAAMYAQYFPAVDPHYGLHNIGLLAALTGAPLYLDTPNVFSYFSTNTGSGSVAISALNDFYGAFGVTGWSIGALLLGALLNRMDMFLVRLKQNAANATLTVFMLVFAFYLSQASLPRALMGYGGVFFVGCWFLLRAPRVKIWTRPMQRSEHVLGPQWMED